MRDTAERPRRAAACAHRLVETNDERIITKAGRLLDQREVYERMAACPEAIWRREGGAANCRHLCQRLSSPPRG